MKRPLAVTGLTALCTQCLLLMVKPFFSLLFSIGTGAAALGCLCIPAMRKRTAVGWVLLVMSVTGGVTSFWQYYGEPIRALDGKTAVIYGRVTAVETCDAYTKLTVEARKVINQRTGQSLAEDIRVILYTYDLVDVHTYDEAEIMLAELEAPKGGFGLTAQSHYAAQGVYILGSFPGDGLTTRSGDVPWYSVFGRIRQAMSDALDEILPEQYAALATAMALGDQSKLSEEIQRDFRFSGLGPVLVVSGLHLSLIIGAIHRVLRKLLGSNRLAAMLSMPLIVVFVGVTGAGSSSIRAAVVMAVALLGILLTRSPEPLNSLGLAAMVLMMLRPCAAGDAGVQLSFAAVSGILLLGQYLNRAMYRYLPEKWLEWGGLRNILSSLCASVGATVFTLPLTALMFGYVPVISVLSNLVAAIPTAIVLVGGVLTGGFGALGWDVLAYPCGWITGQGARMLTWMTEVLAKAPLLYDDAGLLIQLLSAALLCAGVLWLFSMRKMQRLRWMAGAGIVLCLIGVGITAFPDERVRVRVVDCGNGIAVQVRQGSDAVTLLADGTRRDPWTTAMGFGGKTAGTVILLNEQYDIDAVRVVTQMQPGQIGQVTMVSPMLPDEWYGKTLPWPIETGWAGVWRVGEITVTYSGGTDPYCVVQAGDVRILIPMAGTDVWNLPAQDTFAELTVLAYGSIQHPRDIRTKYMVYSAGTETTGRLMNNSFGTSAVRYATDLSGTLEFVFDEYGRVEVICP